MKKYFCLFIILTLLAVPCLSLADFHGRQDPAEAKAYIGRTDLNELFIRKNEDYPFELVLPDWVRNSLTEMEIYEEIYKKVGIDLKEEEEQGRLSVKDGKYYINFKEKKIEKEIIRRQKRLYGFNLKSISLEDAYKVDGLNLEGLGLKSIDDMKYMFNCRILHLENNKLITDYRPFKYLPNLSILSMNDNDIIDITFLTYVNKNIDTFSLNNNNITDISILARFTNLRMLFLSNNKITSLKGLIDLEKLEDLSIDGNPVTLEGLKYIEQLCYSQVLHSLYIDRKAFDKYEKHFALYPEYLQWIDRIYFYEDDGSVTEWRND
jgi:Leucine-rich repeat (LRR) protein